MYARRSYIQLACVCEQTSLGSSRRRWASWRRARCASRHVNASVKDCSVCGDLGRHDHACLGHNNGSIRSSIDAGQYSKGGLPLASKRTETRTARCEMKEGTTHFLTTPIDGVPTDPAWACAHHSRLICTVAGRCRLTHAAPCRVARSRMRRRHRETARGTSSPTNQPIR